MNTFFSSRLKRGSFIALMLTGLLAFAFLFAPWVLGRAAAQTGTFTFTSGGDIGSSANSDASLSAMGSAGGVFTLALGDLGYVGTGGEPAWCNRVKSFVGSTFPFEVVAGNHEDDGQSNGFIGNYAACLPDRMSSTGTYGAEYYFDYSNARVIMAAAASPVNGVNYDYNTVGGTHYNWMRDRIREAKTAGKWVIVGVHKNCITPGTKSCEIGQNFVNLIHNEHVDLFLQGHDHIYGRTKQLTCATANTYNAACVVDSDDSYVRGAGTVTMLGGITGGSQYNINAADAERNYFVKAMGGNGNWNFVTGATNTGSAYGITKVTVATDRIDVVWVTSVNVVAGWGGDSFSIIGGPTPTPSRTPTAGPSPTPTRTNTPGSCGTICNQQATNDATNVYYQFNYTGAFTYHRVYIDTDQSTTTGFQTGGLGANYLLENGSLYSYSGTGTNWSWSLIKAVTYSNSAGLAQWTVARADIGETANPNWADLIFQVEPPLTSSAKYTHVYSGGATATATPTRTNTPVPTATPTKTSTPGSCVNPICNQLATNDATTVHYQYNYTGTFTYYRVYIDTDQSVSTGFQTGGVGANYMLENTRLYSYSGTGTNWSWTLIKTVTHSNASGLVQWTVARADIGETANPNWADLLFEVEAPRYTTAKYTHTYQ